MAKVGKISLVVSLILFAILVNSVGALGADWPNWRGSNYDGISKETGWNPKALSDEAKIVWKASLGIGFSTMSVADGKVYTMGNIDDTDHVYCFNAKSGKEIWKHSYKSPLDPKYYEGGTSATPTVLNGKVYTISKRGKAFCLDAKTGSVVWEKQLEIKIPKWGVAGSAVIVDDLVIFNAAEYGVGIKKAMGEIVWKNGEGPAGYSSAVPYKAGGVKAVVLFGAGEVYAVEAATGKKLWAYPWETKHKVNAADPVIDGDKVFITSGYGHGCSLIKIEGGSASKVWENKNMRSQMSGPVLWKGHLYGIDDKQLVCIDIKTGNSLWAAEETGKGSLMLADGKLIVLGEKGKLFIAEASPEAFKVISSAQIVKGKCWSMPVLSNGMIYARTAGGDLVCVDVRVAK